WTRTTLPFSVAVPPSRAGYLVGSPPTREHGQGESARARSRNYVSQSGYRDALCRRPSSTGQPPRHAWGAVGIRCDDVVGGLVVQGIVPVGWSVPTGTPVTLPPRVLSKCDWPAPPFPGSWVFVTENPSVISAAADLATSNHAIRLDCTNGTPSDVEVD